MVLVYFSGRGMWFIGKPNKPYSKTVYNFIVKDPYTGILESSNDFYRFYSSIDEKNCHEYVGFFKLTPQDEAIFLESKSLTHVHILLPCNRELSAFDITSEDYPTLKESFDNCFFEIQKGIDLASFNNRLPYHLLNKICTEEEYQENSLKKDQYTIDSYLISNMEASETLINFTGYGTWFDTSNYIFPFSNKNGSCFPDPPIYEASGFFALTKQDEEIYSRTNNYDHVHVLLPCYHAESAFFYLVNNKICFYEYDFEYAYFKIYKKPAEQEKWVNTNITIKECSDNRNTRIKTEPPSEQKAVFKERTTQKNDSAISTFIRSVIDQYELEYNKSPTIIELQTYALDKGYIHTSIVKTVLLDKLSKKYDFMNEAIVIEGGEYINKQTIRDCYNKTIYNKTEK